MRIQRARWNVKPGLLGLFLTELEQVQHPSHREHDEDADQDVGQGEPHRLPAAEEQSAHQPADRALGLLDRPVEEEGRQRLGECAGRHAGEDQAGGRGRIPARPRPAVHHQHDEEGAQECKDGDDGRGRRKPRNGDRNRHAQAGAGSDPEQVGIGQRIPEDSLEGGAARSQRHAEQHDEDRARQAQIPNDRGERRRDAGRIRVAGAESTINCPGEMATAPIATLATSAAASSSRQSPIGQGAGEKNSPRGQGDPGTGSDGDRPHLSREG